jgi:hypothetical protein
MLILVLNPFSFVWLWLSEFSDLGGCLADKLLIDPRDGFNILFNLNLYPFSWGIFYRM